MATVDNITVSETSPPGTELVRAQLTASGTSTYVSRRLSNVQGCIVVVEGTNGATFTRSTKTITITGTNDDWVDILLWGTP